MHSRRKIHFETYQVIHAKCQSLTACVPAQTVLVLNICGTISAIDLGGQSATWLIRPAPLGPWQRVFANLPDQDLISGGTSNKGTIWCKSKSEHWVRVNCHLKFGFAVKLTGISDDDGAVLAPRCQESLAVRLRSLAWLPLQNRNMAVMYRGIIGATFTRSLPDLQVIVSHDAKVASSCSILTSMCPLNVAAAMQPVKASY